eukprot:CAMPEP_0178996108 /NCGR_PEP_ID=MMETSP0795-20121207/8198_1 /TAXON_ID=88552 /ORGANISM="Amoebophrya sp., Strain Ameob2" /LENGTH=311 /DNA_ID=CAMNT_0020688487 /DNA_START=1 /DNA_END=936 /DNA_ORIENTATION=-
MGYDTAPSAIHATQIRAFARLCADNEGLIADHPQQAIQVIETGFKSLPHEDQIGIVNWIDRSLNPPTHPWISTESGAVLGAHDIVGSTFFIAMNMMLAFTVFFLLERNAVPVQWKRSVTVAMLVTGIAFWNYFYMRGAWVKTQQSPTVYRYTDWLITVPLQIVEFYLILQATTNVSVMLFWRLLIASIVMLVGGFAGEIGACSVLVGFVIGMLGWLYILFEVFCGEAGAVAGNANSKACSSAFNTLRLIVSVGWAMYPIGYYMVYLGPTFSYHADSVVNIVYNLADFVNKGAFGLCIWAAAKSDVKKGLLA